MSTITIDRYLKVTSASIALWLRSQWPKHMILGIEVYCVFLKDIIIPLNPYSKMLSWQPSSLFPA